MLCYKERHPLLLDYFIPFLKCISNVGRAAISVYESLMGQTSCHFCKEQTSNFMQIWDFEHPLSTQNVLLCYKERYLLLMKCFMTFLRCIKMVERSSDIIYEPLMVHNVLFLPTMNLKFHAKWQSLGTLSAKGMWCCATRRDTHCCLTTSYHSSNI